MQSVNISRELTESELEEEMLYDELETLALLVYAEAGNQGLDGMRYVCDVVLNRVDSDLFPDTITEVIYQESQFGPAYSGGIEKAGWNITEEAYEAVRLEYFGEKRLDSGILYFNTSWDNGTDPFKYGDHWFSY